MRPQSAFCTPTRIPLNKFTSFETFLLNLTSSKMQCEGGKGLQIEVCYGFTKKAFKGAKYIQVNLKVSLLA